MSRYSPPRKRRRSRSRSPSSQPISSHSTTLAPFLDHHCNIRAPGDFWRFHAKYASLPKTDRSKILNLTPSQDFETLYHSLPVRVKRPVFKDLLTAVCVYQDFQQRNKFAKLRKLRRGQADLPIFQHKKEILDKLGRCRVMLIAGDTGCGKSTQVPQYILEGGYKKIVCTQPRRIACVSLAKRVAFETLTDFKSTVGYQIRFEKSKRADTRIVFMTEGLLLRQAAEEETLNSYDVVILDEVHERHLHCDFLVAIMKCMLYKRQDLKVILMSATINLELFQNYFSKENLEVIKVPGRLYPIDIIYKPIVHDPYERKRDKLDCTPYLQIIQMIDDKYQPCQKGDLLIFLNGYSEISTLADAVTEYSQLKQNWIVLQLHSSLSLEEQDKVFDYAPEGTRKCIISTNIAETSVTIDGIRFVIDSGKVNRMTYHTTGGVNKLTEVNISQDSAKQRAGRAGRTGPGTCYRLYSEEDFKRFDVFTPAEIHLVPLDSLLLHMIGLGLTDLGHFPFLETPSSKSIEEGIEKLKYTGALELKECLMLTPLGDALSQLPVDLSIGKMLVLSTVFGNVNAVLALAALLSIQSPLTQSAYRNTEAQDLRRVLDSNHGDPISLLNYYREWLEVKQSSGPKNESKVWAKKRCLEEQRFYEATKLLEQFRDILDEANLVSKGPSEDLSSKQRSIRHGELKQLKSLRYKLKNEKKTERKVLKYEEDDQKTDLRDVEFRITNDFKRLQKLLNEASADSYKDLVLLKLILTSGFYPQIAIEDEYNSSKTVSEKLYHTKNKNFVFLRPMSYFALNPEVLELHNDDVEVPPVGYFSKRPISKKHQLLVYQTILETKKVYLVNTMRVPAIQTLLLFSKTIGTNATFTKFIFDDFLMVDVPYYGEGKALVLKSLKLRAKWKKELELKLGDPTREQNKQHIFYFIDDLVNFMTTEVSYNIKRLLPADLKTVYTRHARETPKNDKNPFDACYKMEANEDLGGLKVTENLTYDCLVQEDWAWDIEERVKGAPFECAFCKEIKLGLDVFQIVQHEEVCRPQKARPEPVKSEGVKGNAKGYHCDTCGKDLVLTPVEILRHKKGCTSAS